MLPRLFYIAALAVRGRPVQVTAATTAEGPLDTVRRHAKMVGSPSRVTSSVLAGRRLMGLLAGLAILGAAPSALAAGEFKVKGVLLPNGAVRVGDDRYRLPEGFDATMKWYKTVYKPETFPRKAIVNQPGIKAIHFVNADPKAEWEGFNLYEFQGEVRLYILGRDKPAS